MITVNRGKPPEVTTRLDPKNYNFQPILTFFTILIGLLYIIVLSVSINCKQFSPAAILVRLYFPVLQEIKIPRLEKIISILSTHCRLVDSAQKVISRFEIKNLDLPDCEKM